MGIKYNWIYPTYDENFIKEIESYNISKNVAKILNARSITDMSSVKKYWYMVTMMPMVLHLQYY